MVLGLVVFIVIVRDLYRRDVLELRCVLQLRTAFRNSDHSGKMCNGSTRFPSAREVTAVLVVRRLAVHQRVSTLAFLVMILACGCQKSAPDRATAEQAFQSTAQPKNATRSLPSADDPFATATSNDRPSQPPSDIDSFVAFTESTVGKPDRREVNPFDPPLTDAQMRDALRQCVRHALTDPELQSTRDFYGTSGNQDIALVDGPEVTWPRGLRPSAAGFRFRLNSAKTSAGEESDRMLGIRLLKLDVRAPSAGFFMDGNVALVLTNVGGARNGDAVGGCVVCYIIQREGSTVIARCSGWFDP